jgi:hypothetical protein
MPDYGATQTPEMDQRSPAERVLTGGKMSRDKLPKNHSRIDC